MQLTFKIVPWEKDLFNSLSGFLQTRVSPSQCPDFSQRWQIFWENATHLGILYGKTNQTVYHMSRSEQSIEGSSVTNLTDILIHRYLDCLLKMESMKISLF